MHIPRKATLALVTLTALLAACQQAATPVAAQAGGMATIHVQAEVPSGVKSQGIRAQGLTNDAPQRYYDVTVRNADGQVVHFNGATYDPNGAGSTTVRLDGRNSFSQNLLLPEGHYSFENKVRYDDEDDTTTGVLLAYGPSSENQAVVTADGSAISLKSHGVLDPSNSGLEPDRSTKTLYTNQVVNLALKLKTQTWGAGMASVPTSDIGPVSYRLGNATDGVLNGQGSKVGVNATAHGSADDQQINVYADFQAWQYDDASDTAQYKTVTLEYRQDIQARGVSVDHLAPALSFDPITDASEGQAVTLSGSATDDAAIKDLRAYVNGELIASTNADDQAPPIATDADGHWSASWTPAGAGTYSVIVIAEDSSGNESRQTQQVSVGEVQATALDIDFSQHSYYVFEVTKGERLKVRVSNLTQNPYYTGTVQVGPYGGWGVSGFRADYANADGSAVGKTCDTECRFTSAKDGTVTIVAQSNGGMVVAPY